MGKEIGAKGGTAIAVPFDVTGPQAVQAGVARACVLLGRHLDVLVHNAGAQAGFGQGWSRTLAPGRWRAPVEINLFGSMNLVSAVAVDMCGRGGVGHADLPRGRHAPGPPRGISFYGPRAVWRASSGICRKSSRRSASPSTPSHSGLQSNVVGEGAEVFAAKSFLRRRGTPENVGAAAVYLASPEASRMTGQILNLNGGSVTS